MTNIPTPVGHGWKVENDTIIPVLMDGPVSAEVLRELVCSCRGRNICASSCLCGTNSLLYTEICPRQSDDKCQNELNKTLVEDIGESKEVLFKILFHQGNSFRVSHVNALLIECVQKIACVNQID